MTEDEQKIVERLEKNHTQHNRSWLLGSDFSGMAIHEPHTITKNHLLAQARKGAPPSAKRWHDPIARTVFFAVLARREINNDSTEIGDNEEAP